MTCKYNDCDAIPPYPSDALIGKKCARVPSPLLSVLNVEDVAKVFDFVKAMNGKFIKAKLFRQKFRLFQAAWLREHSCVTTVMRVLGINKLIITPYQLYKYLKKQGCEQWDF